MVNALYLPSVLFLRSLEKMFSFKGDFLRDIEFSLVSFLIFPSNEVTLQVIVCLLVNNSYLFLRL